MIGYYIIGETLGLAVKQRLPGTVGQALVVSV